MSYRIELIPPARAEIRALCEYLRAQALELVTALGDEPRPPRAKELRGRPEILRIWLAGRWRVAYQIDEVEQRILILCLRHRESIDYDTLPSWMHDSGAEYQSAEISSSSQRSRSRSRPVTRTRTSSPTV